MTAQILALIIFLAMFVLIILEVWDRHLITLGCGLLTLVLVFGLGMRPSGMPPESPLRLPQASTGRRSFSSPE